MDERIRQLERQACTGDLDAKQALAKQQKRSGVKRVFDLFATASKRTRQRYLRHIMGNCNPKCRFCRRGI